MNNSGSDRRSLNVAALTDGMQLRDVRRRYPVTFALYSDELNPGGFGCFTTVVPDL